MSVNLSAYVLKVPINGLSSIEIDCCQQHHLCRQVWLCIAGERKVCLAAHRVDETSKLIADIEQLVAALGQVLFSLREEHPTERPPALSLEERAVSALEAIAGHLDHVALQLSPPPRITSPEDQHG